MQRDPLRPLQPATALARMKEPRESLAQPRQRLLESRLRHHSRPDGDIGGCGPESAKPAGAGARGSAQFGLDRSNSTAACGTFLVDFNQP